MINEFEIDFSDGTRAIGRDLPSLLVIAGQNGAGKSTLLQKLWKEYGTSKIKGRSDFGGRITREPNEIPNIAYFPPHRTPIPIEPGRKSAMEFPMMSYRKSLSIHDYYEFTEADLIPDPPFEDSEIFRRSKDYADFITFYEANRSLGIFETERANKIATIYDEDGKVTPDRISEVFEPLREAINDVLPNLQFKGVNQTLYFYESRFKTNNESEFGFTDLSSGQKDAVSLLLLIEEKRMKDVYKTENNIEEDSLVILLDGIESFHHPALQKRLMNYLYKAIERDDNQDLQIITATHSETVLRAVDNEDIFLINDNNKSNSENRLNRLTDTEQIGTVLGGMGISALASDLPLLLVEGLLDEEILARLFPQISSKFHIIQMRGKKNIENIDKRFAGFIDEMDSMGVEMFGLLDRDRDTSASSRFDSRIHRLPFTCIENSLLQPEALYRACQSLAGENRLQREGISEPSDVEKMLERIIDREEYRKREFSVRLNENLGMQVTVQQSDSLTSATIGDKIDEVAIKNKKRIAKNLTRIKREVNGAIRARNYRHLNGKWIIHYIAEEIGENGKTLTRMTAEELYQIDQQPSELEEIFRKIDDNCSKDLSPLYKQT